MTRLLALSVVVALAASSGCAMCCAPFDWDYPCTGGRWERYNPSSGRVGSAFDEAGGPVGTVDAASASQQPAQSGMQASPTPANPGPATRSVIPRNLGENYLPRTQ